jgi:hypothetical protein
MNEFGYTDSLNLTHEFNANRPTILESASAGILFLVQFAMINRMRQEPQCKQGSKVSHKG